MKTSEFQETKELIFDIIKRSVDLSGRILSATIRHSKKISELERRISILEDSRKER